MPTVLAISPHLDDAVFSAGGTLARLAAEGWEVVVLTVFTGSVADPTGFALACQLDKGLSPEVDYMALRRAEDARACAALGARAEWLPFREAPHRGYRSAPELFANVREDDRIDAPVAEALRKAVARWQPAMILAPQAVGGHVDHVQVVRAIDQSHPSAPVLWWTDWPYAARPHSHPARPFAVRMEALPEQAVAIDPAPRLAACAAYATQLGFQFGGAAGLERALAEAGTVERFRVERDLAKAWPGVGGASPDGAR
ncbi:PIG-L deacetylase family protein [Roseomonas elaeocarpi]|uniref:PIG-L deacetylase family protein n=1 Tax=Roseomonas elaeocarpi TaxID=907779 RepID=A0ABV6JV92_9PROT